MKIALLTDGVYPYVIGGMQKHSIQLAKYFAKEKHTVYLFHCNASKYDINKLEFFSDEEKKYIRSYVIPFPHKRYFPFHYLFESRQYSALIHQSLAKVIGEIDFIYAQGFCAWDLIRNKKPTERPPVAMHFHGFEMFQKIPGLKSNVSKYFLREAVKDNVRKTDYCISYGGKITEILGKITDREKIWEIPGNVGDTWFDENKNQSAQPVRFVFEGRYERRKGIKELHAAIKKLLPAGGFTFDFIGPVPEEHKIIAPGITYHGQLSSEAVIKNIFTGADILVCPSYAEGMPYVVMEAMACGLAVIATDAGGVSQLVGNDNGWLLPRPDVSLIADAMQQAMHNWGAVLEQKKRNSAEKIKHFRMDDLMKKLIHKMEESVKKVSSPRE